MSLQSARAFDSASSGMLRSVCASDIIRSSAGRYSRNLSFIARGQTRGPHATQNNLQPPDAQKSPFSRHEISWRCLLWLISQSTIESVPSQHLHPRRNANSLLIYLQWEHMLHTSSAHGLCIIFGRRFRRRWPIPTLRELNNKCVSEWNTTCRDMHETHVLEASIVGEQYGVAVLLYAHAKIFLEPVQTLST